MALVENGFVRSPSIVLCLDSEAARRPEAIGLPEESLLAQPWLKVLSSGTAARDYLHAVDASSEVWVVSSDDVDPINLAAAIKRDHRNRRVSLVAFEDTGSLKSRASSAGIDAVMGLRDLALRYREAKRASSSSGTMRTSAPPLGARPTPRAAPSSAGLGDGRQTMPIAAVRSDAAAWASRTFPIGAPMASNTAAFIMPVVSGSGGAGKSTVSVLASIACQRLGYRTAFVDLDLQFGDGLALFGRDDAVRVDEVIENPALLARLDQGHSSLPTIIAAPKRLERAEVIAKDVSLLIDALAGSFDVIIANTGSLWGEQHAAILERSTKALFLIDQRPSSLRACQHALELCARCGIATNPFLFAVNRCERGALYTSIDVSCALRGANAVELAEGGPDVEEALAAGQPEDLLEYRNDLCESIRDVLIEVIPGCAERAEAQEDAVRPRGLFRRRRQKARAACL